MQFKFWISLGICQIGRACSQKFEEWNWSRTGHGHYCVRQDGMVFSHSDAKVNCQRKSFFFKSKDKLYFEYNPKKDKLKIEKENGGRYEMNIERCVASEYAFCAYLVNSEDSVELID